MTEKIFPYTIFSNFDSTQLVPRERNGCTKTGLSKLALLCAAVLAASLLSSCSAKTKSALSGGTKGQVSESETQAVSAPVTVQDAEGEDVMIYSAPKRIVILPVWASEMILNLVDTSRIAALSPSMDSDTLTACSEQAAKVNTRVTGEAEAIVSLNPDLVLLDNYSDSTGALSQALKDAGEKVLKLDSPMNFDEIGARLDTISAAVFAKDKGEQIKQDMNDRLSAVKEKVSAVTTPAKVMVCEEYCGKDGTDTGSLYAYGKDSPFNAIAEEAGAVNVCSAASGSAVSKETVVNDWKPDLLVVSGITYEEDDESFKPVSGDGSEMKDALQKDAVLKSLPAVQNNRMAALTEKYRRSTSQYMVNAVEELAKACYPDLFK